MDQDASTFDLITEEALSDVGIAASAVAVAVVASAAQKAGVAKETVDKVQAGAGATRGIVAVGKTVLGTGAAVTSATGLTVAATSGAGNHIRACCSGRHRRQWNGDGASGDRGRPRVPGERRYQQDVFQG